MNSVVWFKNTIVFTINYYSIYANVLEKKCYLCSQGAVSWLVYCDFTTAAPELKV